MALETIIFWSTTLIVASVCGAAGVMNVLGVASLRDTLVQLGYPPYFGRLLGCWQLLGLLGIMATGFPRVQEWAYAGLFINFTGAVVAHLAASSSIRKVLIPASLTVLLVGSWALRTNGPFGGPDRNIFLDQPVPHAIRE